MKSIVVIPTYNEAENILGTLDAVIEVAPYLDVLVVDDNSPDGTARLVADHAAFGDRIHLLVREGKAGLGAAYRAGFAQALEAGYEVIVQMDADFSHPPERILALIEATVDVDIAVGSRYVRGGRIANWTLPRRLISRAGNLYVRLVLGLTVRDATSGFKAFRRDALLAIGALTSESEGYSFQIENTWRAHLLGLRTLEVPITFTDRASGVSKMSTAIIGEALIRVVSWRWRQLRGHLEVPEGRPAEPNADQRHVAA